ncbi:squalene/phytoene synthase family protein [Falsiroseomonas sp.]|uniref:squalene/phytoene synthase family protein n=1 Tax=Falsiroseomonas sp. TaxID=2870721 RepID=UPI00356498E7
MPDTSAPAGETAGDLAGFVRLHDPDRFLCALFAPAERRPALFALLAYNHELARAREAASNPIAALIRLQWWREAVAEAAEGRPARRHEVATPLHAAIAAGLLDPADLSALADAREAEAAEEGLPTRVAFAAHLRGTAGGVAVAAGRLLGAAGEALVALQALGAAYGLAGVLRSVAAHAAQGRCLLPGDALAEAGLDAAAVIQAPESAAPVIRRLAEAGLGDLAAARAAAGGVPRGAVAAALPAVLAARDLRRLAAGREVPAPRGLGDRMAVTLAGLRGRA